jgi:hypothetical protein
MGGKREGAGRPKGVPNLAKMVLQHRISDKDVALALSTLRDAMASDNWKARISAAQYLLDQKFGKARQSTEITGKDGGPVRFQWLVANEGQQRSAENKASI